jgi:hypothetical protein
MSGKKRVAEWDVDDRPMKLPRQVAFASLFSFTERVAAWFVLWNSFWL